MKKMISLLLCLCLFAGVLCGCGAKKEEQSAVLSSTEEETPLSVVATIFPAYDWVQEIVGEEREDISLTLLTGTGVDLHSFQPSVEDILTISTCDLFIYVGGESDDWVEEALAEAINEDMIVINLLELLGDAAKEEETIEGMEAEEEEEDEDEEEIEYDEHVWLSLSNAALFCDCLSEALSALDEAHAEDYQANNAAYQEELSALDGQYSAICASAAQSTLLFGDRFPFRYLLDDYSLSYYAAFNGCSAETEASFETVVFLAQKVDELGLSAVLCIETSDQKLAATVIENTTEKNQQILVLHSMQAVTEEDLAAGVTYLSLAEENLAVLEEALR